MKTRSLILSILLLFSVSLLPIHAHAQDSTGLDRNARAEIRFLEGMIDHHQMAVDMAQDCLIKATSDSVKELCQNIINAQSIEIATMQGMLRTWYQIDYTPMSMGQMGGMGGMMDMMSMMCNMMGSMDHNAGAGMPNMETPIAPEQHEQHHPGGTPMPGTPQAGMGDMTPQAGMSDMTPQAGMNDGMSGGMMGSDGMMSEDMMGMMMMMCDMMMSGGMMGGQMEGHQGDGGMMGGMEGGMMGGGQSAGDPAGMMGMMAGLHNLEGEAYEIAWLEAMIDHHDDALHMAERILPRAVHDEVSAMAQQIIDDQTAEIATMEAMLAEYEGSDL